MVLRFLTKNFQKNFVHICIFSCIVDKNIASGRIQCIQSLSSADFEKICFKRRSKKFLNLHFVIIFLSTCSFVSFYTGENLFQVKKKSL